MIPFENSPEGNFLIIPEVSSERRNYIPLGFESPPVKMMPNASLYHFGILTSQMHNAMRTVAGRLRFRYSIGISLQQLPLAERCRQKEEKSQ